MRVACSALAVVGVAVAAALGCRADPPPGFDAAAATAFQRDAEARMRTPTSPLSVVDAFYLGPGQQLGLTVSGREATPAAVPADGAIELAVGKAFECRAGCGGADGAITASVQVPLPPLALTLAPQPAGDAPGGRVLVHDERSPALVGHQGLAWYPVSDAHIVVARFDARAEPQSVELTTTRGLQKRFVAAGTLAFELGGATHSLVAYRAEGGPASEPMLVPFTDATTGHETYPVGRYVYAEANGGTAVIDFNRATNPWCAYSPHYNCPVPPVGNRVDAAVEAGEKSYPAAQQ